MNKLAILSILAICFAIAAAGNGRIGRRNRDDEGSGGIDETVEEPLEPTQRSRRQGRRRNQEFVENAEGAALNYDPTNAPRRRNKAGRARATVTEPLYFSTTTPYVQVRPQLSRRGNGVQAAQRVLGSEAAAGQQVGAEAGAVAQSSLQAGERNLDSVQALLQKKQARQERIDAKAERKERRKEAARVAAGEKLQAQNSVDFEEYQKAEEFHDLTAAANKDIQNQFVLQLMSANSHKEDAAISESSGSKFDAGTRYSIDEAVNAESFLQEEAISEDEFVDNQLVDAEIADENLFNAQEASRVENEATIDAQNYQQSAGNFRDSDSFFGSSAVGGRGSPFGSNNIFGNNPFGTIFRR